jgi:CelD/BcsL family acetyltransferase involved in cellulose biosynthesis
MVPFERASRYRGIPANVMRLLKPPYARLCTPLFRKDVVRESVSAMLDWLASSPESGSLVEFRFMTGEGRVAQELHQQTTHRRWIVCQTESTVRALLKPVHDAETYLNRALRGRRRKEYQRLWSRLSEAGPTEYRALGSREDARHWVTAFLDLEVQGWKGREGTALASREKDRSYFETVALDAHRHGQLMMGGLFHQERPIALKMNLLSGRGAFAVKIAFDEHFARYSPGMLLEMENVRRVHAMPGIDWMDSTADMEHFMINRLWTDRRTVETFLVSPGRFWGNVVASTFPLLRGVKFMLQRRPGPQGESPSTTKGIDDD